MDRRIFIREKGVRKDFKEEWNWLRYMIEDKMFAAVCYDDHNQASLITLKLDPAEGDFLIHISVRIVTEKGGAAFC